MKGWLSWQPTNYVQAWLVALGVGLILLVADLASGGRLYGTAGVAVLTVASGIAGTIRIRKRRITAHHRPTSPTSSELP